MSAELILEVKTVKEEEARERAKTGFIGLLYPMFKAQDEIASFSLQFVPHGKAGILGSPPKLNEI